MTNNLPIVLSGSAILFAAGLLVKYGKFLNGKRASGDAENEDCVLVYGGKSQEVGRRCDVARIIHYLHKSKVSIAVCLGKMTNAELAAALVDIQKKGSVEVRVLLHGTGCEAACRASLLRENGIEVKKVTPSPKVQHNFIVMDAGALAPTALVGALDSVAGDRRLYDCTLVTAAPFVTVTLAREFNRLWNQFG